MSDATEVAVQFAGPQAWRITSSDEASAVIVSALARVMRLEIAPDDAHWPLIRVTCTAPVAAVDDSLSSNKLHDVFVNPAWLTEAPVAALSLVAESVLQVLEAGSGLALHAALAEFQGRGVLLVGPGGAGKTTASRRLPPTWRSWSDDTTVVVADNGGCYWAHPWPTWSRLWAGESASWPVEHAVPLAAVCLIEQAAKDRLQPLGHGESVGELVHSTEQVSWQLTYGKDAAAVRAVRLRRFEKLCRLVPIVPVFKLSLSLTGDYWSLLEDALRRQAVMLNAANLPVARSPELNEASAYPFAPIPLAAFGRET